MTIERITALSLLCKQEREAIIKDYLFERYENNLSAIAQAFSVSVPAAFYWVHGRRVPTGVNLKKFEHAMNDYVTAKSYEYYSRAEKIKGIHIFYRLLPIDKAIDYITAGQADTIMAQQRNK